MLFVKRGAQTQYEHVEPIRDKNYIESKSCKNSSVGNCHIVDPCMAGPTCSGVGCCESNSMGTKVLIGFELNYINLR